MLVNHLQIHLQIIIKVVQFRGKPWKSKKFCQAFRSKVWQGAEADWQAKIGNGGWQFCGLPQLQVARLVESNSRFRWFISKGPSLVSSGFQEVVCCWMWCWCSSLNQFHWLASSPGSAGSNKHGSGFQSYGARHSHHAPKQLFLHVGRLVVL